MSQSKKPTSKPAETPQQDQPLPEADLEKVSGGKGKVTLGTIKITKHYDKSSPTLN